MSANLSASPDVGCCYTPPVSNTPYPLPCFRCGKKIEQDPFTGGLVYGISFTSPGGYGSTVYDPCDSRTRLRIDVCDECVTERGEQGAVLEATVIPKPAEVRYNCWQPHEEDDHDGPVG